MSAASGDDDRQRLAQELARITKCDAFGALGLGQDADNAAVRAAFLRVTKQYHPNRFARRDAETRRLANEVFLLLKRAYEAVGDEEARGRELARLAGARLSPSGATPPATTRIRTHPWPAPTSPGAAASPASTHPPAAATAGPGASSSPAAIAGGAASLRNGAAGQSPRRGSVSGNYSIASPSRAGTAPPPTDSSSSTTVRIRTVPPPRAPAGSQPIATTGGPPAASGSHGRGSAMQPDRGQGTTASTGPGQVHAASAGAAASRNPTGPTPRLGASAAGAAPGTSATPGSPAATPIGSSPGTRGATPTATTQRLHTLAAGRATTAPPSGSPGTEEEAAFDAVVEILRKRQWTEGRKRMQELAVAHPKQKRYRVHMHYAWGREHLDAGRIDDARAEFRRSLNLDPSFRPSERALAELPAPDDDKPPTGGLFSKLFRKP